MKSTAIKSWKYEHQNSLDKDKTICYEYFLYKNSFKTHRMDDEGLEIETYSFEEFLNSYMEFATDEIVYDILKSMTVLDKPHDLSPQNEKKWQFWKAFDNANLPIEDIVIDKEKGYSYYYNKYGIGSRRFNWQTFDNFFFHGPKKENLPLSAKKRMRKIVFNALNSSKHHLTIKNDAFPLFDYDKVKTCTWEFGNSSRGERLSLKGGVILFGSWEPNPRNSGGGSRPIEYYWVDLEKRIPPSFKQYIPEIRASLEAALVKD